MKFGNACNMLFPCKHYPQGTLLKAAEAREERSCREHASRRLMQGTPEVGASFSGGGMSR